MPKHPWRLQLEPQSRPQPPHRGVKLLKSPPFHNQHMRQAVETSCKTAQTQFVKATVYSKFQRAWNSFKELTLSSDVFSADKCFQSSDGLVHHTDGKVITDAVTLHRCYSMLINHSQFNELLAGKDDIDTSKKKTLQTWLLDSVYNNCWGVYNETICAMLLANRSSSLCAMLQTVSFSWCVQLLWVAVCILFLRNEANDKDESADDQKWQLLEP